MQPLLLGPGEGDLIRIGGFETLHKVSRGDTESTTSIVEHTLAPGLLGAPLHRHSREDEISYVLDGELSVQIGDRTTRVTAGGCITKPRDLFHTFWNAGDRPVRFLEIISPGGFERYFDELAALIPGDSPPDMKALVELAARYGVEFDLASIPALIQAHGLRLG